MTWMQSPADIDRQTLGTEKLRADIANFASRMRLVPRKAYHCELYGTVSTGVDVEHALNIFRKVFPGTGINKSVAYDALVVLQNRIDDPR